MSVRSWLDRLHIDLYLLAILGMVALASVFPCRGAVANGFSDATATVIGLLFFLYGARLSRQAVWQGLSHWRLHTMVLTATFVLFPVLGLAARLVIPQVLPAELYLGILFLCTLPSTVQSSIAFTTIAGGNVAAAVCAASSSSLIGILVIPVLVGLLMRSQGGGVSFGGVEDIAVQLLLPFLAGQLARPWIGGWLGRHQRLVGLVDRGSILLITYTAFSEGVVNGIWHQLDLRSLVTVAMLDMFLLASVLAITTIVSRRLGFSREDEIAIVFCGSKKSLASGVAMATVLFSAQAAGLIVLPLMLFQQMQLMVCAMLARRYASARVLPDQTARQLPEQSTIPWMDSSSTGDTRHRGALQNQADCVKTRIQCPST
jgi:sodium/bile acid cotransporter 7